MQFAGVRGGGRGPQHQPDLVDPLGLGPRGRLHRRPQVEGRLQMP
ncbi:hypothetical protein M2156_008095 [Streptomyces sp. SAI-149]|nr:hypothetical protein [Streptomyces sp. SAI-149]